MWGFCFSCSIPPPAASSSSSAARRQHTMNTTPSTQHHQHININHHHQHITINHHHQHITINPSPSTQHHQHNTITTTPSTITITTTPSTITINTSPSTITINTSPSTITINTSPSTITINTTPSTQHHPHNPINTTPSTQPYLHSTWSTFIEVSGSPASSDDFGRRVVLRGRRGTWSTSSSFCVAGAALRAPQARFAWQVQHLEHLRLVLRGRRSTWSTSGSFLRGRRGTWSTSGSFCVAGTALGAPPARFAWQAQHLEHLRLVLRAKGSTWSTIHTTPSTLHHQTHHYQHNTISTTSSTQPHQHITIYSTPSTQYHLDNTIDTTPSTLHHQTQHHQHTPSTLHQQHHIINTTSSTHHHLHNTIHATTSTLHHQTLAGAALGALPSYPFCLIPADSPFSSLWIVLCFVSLTYSIVGWPKTLLTCGVIRSNYFEDKTDKTDHYTINLITLFRDENFESFWHCGHHIKFLRSIK